MVIVMETLGRGGANIALEYCYCELPLGNSNKVKEVAGHE